MTEYADLVRFRNDGDEFHVLWTARRALRILDASSGLVAVTVEGISEKEEPAGDGVATGILVVDTTEYFGSENVRMADRVIYNQLKYSPTAPAKPWAVSGLKDTLSGFGERYQALCQKYGQGVVVQKVRFRFLTNRPISAAVLQAVQAAAAKTSKIASLSKSAKAALKGLRDASCLKLAEFREFARLLELEGGQKSRPEQQAQLEAETADYLPQIDLGTTLLLKELVRSRTRSDAAADSTIRRANILNALHAVEDDVLPAPPRFEKLNALVRREQEADLVKAILAAQAPVVVHAPGGVGKSVLAQRLPTLLPPGSEAVVFDGFANGAYRSPRDRRHRHDRGLVHIANTLAARSLCNPLMKLNGAGDVVYLQAFWKRLAEASAIVRRRSPNAVLLIVMDAADNTVMAAEQANENCFVPELLADTFPDNCRMVAFVRTHRRDYLKLAPRVLQIPLAPFSLAESTVNLRLTYRRAKDTEARAFHAFTDANPRVQGNALATTKTLRELMASLGPAPKTVEVLIQGQLNSALDKVIAEQGGEQDIRRLGVALSALPPAVPLRILAKATGLAMAAIESFATDFAGGRPLLIHGESVQFRDEPVETWFREHFLTKAGDFGELADSILNIAQSDGYAASALPALLWRADRHQALFDLALHGQPFNGGEAVEQREILFRRVQFAFRAALRLGRLPETMKLLLRAAEEIATSDRLSGFLLDNADLVAALAGPDVVYDFIFRKRVWRDSGRAYSQCAAMLASNPHTQAEAHRFFSLARAWLNEWRTRDQEKRERLEESDITSFAFAQLYLNGQRAAVRFIGGWTPKIISFNVGVKLCHLLRDRGDMTAVADLLAAAENNVLLRLACLQTLIGGYVVPVASEVETTIALLVGEHAKGILTNSNIRTTRSAIVTLLEQVARLGQFGLEIAEMLSEIKPESKYVERSFDSGGRSAAFRIAALVAAIDRRQLALEELKPESVLKAEAEKRSQSDQDARRFQKWYGALLPWYRLRAEVIAKWRTPDAVLEGVEAALTEVGKGRDKWEWNHDQELGQIANEIVLLWFDCLAFSGLATDQHVERIRDWLSNVNVTLFTPTLTELARRSCCFPATQASALKFAHDCRELITGEHGDASSTANSFADLARAVFAPLADEAKQYFKLGLEHLDRLGEELHDRFFSLAEIAKRAGQSGASNPRAAYRFARMSELFHEYNDHKFPWGEAAEAVALLDPPSLFAVASRWQDRHAAWMVDTIPPGVMALRLVGRMPTSWIAALHVFGGYWQMRNSAPLLLDGEPDPAKRQLLLDTYLRDIEFGLSDEGHVLTGLLSAARNCGLNCDRLDAVIAHHSAVPDRQTTRHEAMPAREERPTPATDWDAILAAGSLITSEGLYAVEQAYRAQDVPFEADQLYMRMRVAVSVSLWPDHVRALAGVPYWDVWQILDALESAARCWNYSAAVKATLREAINKLVQAQPLDVRVRRWRDKSDLQRCADLSGEPLSSLTMTLLEALPDHLEQASAGALFELAGYVCKEQLTAEEALDVLDFGLDRLEPIYKPDDGDGAWNAALEPPAELPSALAGFLYARLAAPEPEVRWRAAHAVRRLCQLGQQDVVDALVSLLDSNALPAFTDRTLPFYSWHARLYLLIALARAALDHPQTLVNHVAVLADYALRKSPHVLVRHFAGVAVLTVEHAVPGTISLNDLPALSSNNSSPLPPVIEANVVEELEGDGGYLDTSLHHDFDRYWLESLAKVFGKPARAVTRRVDHWVAGKWAHQGGGRWDADPRGRRQFYRDRDTLGHHGSYPNVDTHSFYLSYHAMFCAAGEMLREWPVVAESRSGSRWEDWLRSHALTRPDGKWLADRRDAPPLIHRPWQTDTSMHPWKDEWRWSITTQDFEDVLGVQRGTKIVVRASWAETEGYASEDVYIDSALVTPGTSDALLRAMQTAETSHEYHIPSEGGDLEIRHRGFKMTGWIHDPHNEHKLDQADPLAGQLPWPGPQPGRGISRLFQLKADAEHRIWKTGNVEVAWMDIWGDRKEGRDGAPKTYGKKLTVHTDLLLKGLRMLKRDLIFKVSIERTNGQKQPEIEYQFRQYTRVFLLKGDGTLHSLPGIRRLRPEAGSGARAGRGPRYPESLAGTPSR